jgi:hypothetical protein
MVRPPDIAPLIGLAVLVLATMWIAWSVSYLTDKRFRILLTVFPSDSCLGFNYLI